MILKRILLISFVLLINTNLFSQNRYQKDTALINYYNNQTRSYLELSLDTADLYIDSMKAVLGRIDYPRGMGIYNHLLGNKFYEQHQYDSSNFFYERSVKYYTISGDSTQKYNVLGNEGMVFIYMGKLDTAKLVLKKVIRFAKKNNQTESIAKTALSLSQAYTVTEDWNNAIKYILLSDSSFIVLGDTFKRTYCLNSLAIIYSKIGDYEKSLANYQLGIKYSKMYNPKLLAYFYSNLGDFYSRTVFNEDSAIYYLNNAKIFSRKYNLNALAVSVDINLSGLYYHTEEYEGCISLLRKYWNSQRPIVQSSALINAGIAMTQTHNDSARALLKQGIIVSKENNLLENLKNGYSALSYLDSIEGDFYNAYLNYLNYSRINDTLYNRELQETIVLLKQKNLMEKLKAEKENIKNKVALQNEIIKRKTIFNRILIVASGIILFMLIVLLFLRQKRKALTKELQERNKELRATEIEINEKNKELTMLNKMKSTLFSIISHDLKSYLGTSNQLIQVFYNDYDNFSEKEKKTILKSLVNSSNAVYSLTENLLSWSRLQEKNSKYILEQMLLKPVVDRVISTVNHLSNKKHITIENHIEAEVSIISHDKIMEVVLRNLLSNAIKFTDKKGHISIKGKRSDGFYEICVEDNGAGIPTEKLGQLFDMESDYHTIGTYNENGSGFGLKLVKLMVEEMGGRIWIESQEGVGSKFFFTVKEANQIL